MCRAPAGIYAIAAAMFVLAGCATAPTRWDGTLAPETWPSSASPEWIALAPGIEYAVIAREAPRLAIYCARIDLREKSLSVFVTPASPVGGKETSLMKTTTFAKRYGAMVAINATPFDTLSIFEGTAANIAGTSLVDGIIASPTDEAGSVIAWYRSGKAAILAREDLDAALAAQTEAAPAEGNPETDAVQYAASGFGPILNHGKNLWPADRPAGKTTGTRTSRTAAGVSDDGETLYLLVIDGKDAAHSVGVTFSETADWIAFFGADSALMLDGGGSSSFVVADANGKPSLLNRPVQNSIIGLERPVATHIGVRSTATR
jgi:exopolysaccharide biosynthesis protein